MRQPYGTVFAGMTTADLVTAQATPPASVTLLQQADSWPVIVGTYPYQGCGYITGDGVTGRPTDRRLMLPVAPGGLRLRYAVTRATGSTLATPPNVTASTDYGGTTGADVATIIAQQAYALAILPHSIYDETAYLSGDWDDATPAVTMNRMLELEPLPSANIEGAMVSNAQAFSFVVARMIDDLESL